MPTYEYTCRDCGHTFEIVQSMWDEPLTMCPECGGSLRKVFAPPAISFKGSGFYATDHRRKSPTPPGKDEATTKGDTSEKKDSAPKKDGTAGDGKPARASSSSKEPAAP